MDSLKNNLGGRMKGCGSWKPDVKNDEDLWLERLYLDRGEWIPVFPEPCGLSREFGNGNKFHF